MKKFVWSALIILLSCKLEAQTSLVQGTVMDENGRALSGVSVELLPTGQGVFTDEVGRFQLQVPKEANRLRFALLGFTPQEYAIPSDGQPLMITLYRKTHTLQEVVVVGFGERSRKELTTAVNKLDAGNFRHMPITQWEQALQGQLPGVVLTPASGSPDAAVSIRVRGAGSISAGNQPLIVVDGIVLSGQGGTETLGYPTNPFLNLNPDDIASIEVLKDAAATAIYGAQGGNGVILITTKSGAYEAAPQVQLDYSAGFSEASRRYDLLTGQEYASLWNEAAANGGITGFTYTVENEPSTDWASLLLRRGFLQQATASVSGGSRNSRYFISGSFRNQDGYLITTNLKRYSLRTQFEQRLGERWTLGVQLAPSRVVNHRVGNQFTGSPFGWASWYYPNLNAFNETGQPIRTPLSTSIGWGGFRGNPLLTAIDQEIKNSTQQLLARSELAFHPWPTLSLRTEVGTEINQEDEYFYAGPATFFGRGIGSGSTLHQHLCHWQWTSQFEWRPTLSTQQELTLTGGLQYLRTAFVGDYLSGSGLPIDQIRRLTTTAQIEEYFSWHTASAFVGYYSRLNLSRQDRYLLTLSARYDGSSRFGRDRRFGFFPAAAAGWVVSEEDFFSMVWINHLKVRASIGLSGNAAIGDFAARGLAALNNDYTGQPGFLIESLENRDLGWERSRQWDIGLDFEFYDHRLRGSIDYYQRDTRDLLLQVPTPATNGVSVLWQNIGAMRNQGLEVLVAADVLVGPVQWTVQFTGATLHNNITQLPDFDGDGQQEDLILNGRNLFRTGETAGAFYLVHYAGVDPQNGDALFSDLAGNTLSNHAPAENRQVVGSPLPRFTGGINQIIRYQRFSLSLFLQGKIGHSKYWIEGELLANNLQNGNNQVRSQLNAWRPDNPNTNVPQARLFQNNGNQPSTRYLYRADFLRLNNITLTYEFPFGGKKDYHCRLYATAQNLFTWTSFPGLDPDSEFQPPAQAAQGSVLFNLPAARTFTLGFHLNL